MASLQQPAPQAGARTDIVTAVLTIVGLTQLATGAIALVAPGGFYDLFAAYPPQNDHFIMDLGSWQVALGAIALYGARQPAWRVPLLGFLALQYTLHTIPHVLHAGDTDPAWHGGFGLATQAFGAVVLGALFLREVQRSREGAQPPAR